MKKIDTDIHGVYIIEKFNLNDNRGSFTKIYNEEELKKMNIPFEVKECFYSISKKNVIRGLHFQKPPFEHEKLVTVLRGKVKDVIVDLRKSSSTYGKHIAVELSENNKRAIFIPKGCAHGFIALEDNTIMLYMVSTVHSKEHDSGIKWDSINFDWEIENPIISEKDQKFDALSNFNSPF